MGSKRYNRTENISCRRSIFNFLWREADENWTEYSQLVSHHISLSRVLLNSNYPSEKNQKSAQKPSCHITKVAENKGIK